MKRLLNPRLELPRLEVPRLGLAAFRQRILLRGVFVLLAVATVSLSVVVLKDEKERAWQAYQHGFVRSQAEVMARLRHPSGRLALLNAGHLGQGVTPLAPLLLPYAAIDFDDPQKSQQAVEMAGCSVQYPDGASLCAAIGNNPYAGGFIYLVGSFFAGELTPRERAQAHRTRITLDMRGSTYRWIAPYEAMPQQGSRAGNGEHGRLTGFVDNGTPQLDARARPVRDFRGWLWQNGHCRDLPPGVQGNAGNAGNDKTPPAADCLRRTHYSIRLPVELFREALFRRDVRPVWQPEDLGSMRVRVEMLAPGDTEPPLFDSNAPGAQLAASLNDISRSLLPGERVQIRKVGADEASTITLKGVDVQAAPSAPWLLRLISWLPLHAAGVSAATMTPAVPTGQDILDTPTGNYTVSFTGHPRDVEQGLAAVATRLSWYLGAMLAAIALAWLIVELGLIRRVTALTRRAAAVSYNVQDGHVGPRLGDLEVSDLRGSDELGILAGGLADLLQRVKDDLQREQLRAQQERDMWHAVGHEIMSPLQSLMVLYGPDDPGHRYVQRMQQAVHVLYGTASPAEALQAATVPEGRLDLDAFLSHVAANAHYAGIADVVYEGGNKSGSAGAAGAVIVRADEFALEDVVTHILRNADSYRPAGRHGHHAVAVGLRVHRQRHAAQPGRHHCGGPAGAHLRAGGVRAPGAFCRQRRRAPGTGPVRGQDLHGQDGRHDQGPQHARWRGLHADLPAPGLRAGRCRPVPPGHGRMAPRRHNTRVSIPQSFIQELLARVDVVDIVGRYVQLRKGGANFMGLCPFHSEKSPSFTVSPSKQFYHCFGCGKNGNAIGFLMDHAGMGFVEAVQDLAGQVGLQVPQDDISPAERERQAAQKQKQATLTNVLEKAGESFRKHLKASPQAIEYLKRRGVSGETARRFGLGYAPAGWRNLASVFAHYDDPQLEESGLVIVGEDDGKRYDRFRDRLMFPIRNVKGECIGFGGRVFGDEKPKYLNSPETPVFHKGRELYGLFEARTALRDMGYALVTEGYMDVVALAQLGFANAVATLGTACTPDHIHKLFRFTDAVVFSFDGDGAGRRAARKALDAALPYASDTRSVKFLFLPAEHDPDSFIREYGSEAFARYVGDALPLSRFLIEAASEGCDLGQAEGRAHMASNARPLWTALPDGALKRQLLGEIAELVQLDARDLSDLWSQEAARSGPARGSMAGGASHPGQQAGHAPAAPDWGQPVEYGAPSGWHERGGHGSGAGGWRSGEPGRGGKKPWPRKPWDKNGRADFNPPPMGPRGAPATRTDQAARLLMAHMEFMEELTHEDFEALAHCSGEHGAMFRWMEAQFQESGARPFAVLREQLRGLPHETLADRLMSGPHAHPEGELPELRRELRDVLNRMVIVHIKAQIDEALRDMARDPSAAQRYRDLFARQQALENQMRTSS